MAAPPSLPERYLLFVSTLEPRKNVIGVLRGSENERILRWGHHRLPTYGVGKDLDANQWRSVFRQLVARGYLRVDMDRFGALCLEEQCRPLLRGEESIQLRRDRPRGKGKQQTRTALPENIDVNLWEALRDRRRELAEEQGVPPYVIFHDATLKQMAEHRPQTEADLLSINGVGEAKLARYGSEFLEVIAAGAGS